MEVEDVQMRIQSYLCKLGTKDLEEIAKTLGCSDSDVKEENRKGLARLIEERLESKLEETEAEKLEYLGKINSTRLCVCFSPPCLLFLFYCSKKSLALLRPGNIWGPVRENINYKNRNSRFT